MILKATPNCRLQLPHTSLRSMRTSRRHRAVDIKPLSPHHIQLTKLLSRNHTSKMAPHILLLNGPNLNLLGTREPSIYGKTTLAEIESAASSRATSHGASLEAFQSNHEGALVDAIHAARGRIDAIIINPAALTHTSVALRDALAAVSIPFVEIHVSNVLAREDWRRHSYLSDKAVAVISGMGPFGYEAAVEFLVRKLKQERLAKL
jgi:3-dehydroquinate dehydratase II